MNSDDPQPTGSPTKSVAVRSTMFAVGTQLLKAALYVVFMVVLARFVSPGEFGVLAIVIVMSSFFLAVREAGLSSATIQKPTILDIELNSMHWLNVLMGVGAMLLFFAATPLALLIYNFPQLKYLLPFYGIIGLIHSFSIQRTAWMQRNFLFDRLAICEAAAMSAGIVSGMIALFFGLGILAYAVMDFVNTLLLWILISALSPWKPKAELKLSSVSDSIGFGSTIMLTNILTEVTKNMDIFFMSLIFGPTATGLYSQAQNILNRPLRQFVTPALAVFKPLLARIQGTKDRFVDTLDFLSGVVASLATFIVVIGISGTYFVIYYLLGENWLGAVDYYIALAPFAVVEPIAGVYTVAMIAKGDSLTNLRWQFCRIGINVTALGVGALHSAIGMAIVYSLAGLLIRWPLFTYYCAVRADLPVSRLMSSLVPPLVSGLLAGGLAAVLFYNHHGDELQYALVNALISVMAYVASLLMFSRGRKMLQKLLDTILFCIRDRKLSVDVV